MAEQVNLTVSQLKQDKENGLSTKEMAKNYGVPEIALKKLFSEHPLLKTLKTKRGVKINLIDDITPTETQVVETTTELTVEETPVLFQQEQNSFNI